MAVTVVTPVSLALETVSADLGTSLGAIVATTPATGFEISPPAGFTWDHCLLYLEVDASGDTIVIKAGDNPPSARAALGDLSIVMAALDVRVIVVEGGRHAQDDNKLLITCTDAGTLVAAVFLPKL